jgi:hypothetical protein
MKKLHLLLLAGVALVAVSVYAYEQVRRDAQGLHIGSAVTDRIGMWGATPVVRQTITNTAPVLGTLTQSSKAASTAVTVNVGTATLTVSFTPLTVDVTNAAGAVSACWTGCTATVAGVVTSAVPNTVYGFASDTAVVITNTAINAIAGYSGTNQLNQVRNALVNVGIASTTGQ